MSFATANAAAWMFQEYSLMTPMADAVDSGIMLLLLAGWRMSRHFIFHNVVAVCLLSSP